MQIIDFLSNLIGIIHEILRVFINLQIFTRAPVGMTCLIAMPLIYNNSIAFNLPLFTKST